MFEEKKSPRVDFDARMFESILRFWMSNENAPPTILKSGITSAWFYNHDLTSTPSARELGDSHEAHKIDSSILFCTLRATLKT